MEIKIALAGNPNCGKTTLFNRLTGANQYVGNWPGVTVEKKEGFLKGHPEAILQDLPGIYSLSPYSPEERVTRRYLVDSPPDVILNIVDGTNIQRNLYLTTQLLELGRPLVLAVNMMDLVRKKGGTIDLKGLEKALGCPCVEISALKGEGCMAAAEAALALAGKKPMGKPIFTGHVEKALADIEKNLQVLIPSDNPDWYAVKLFERDEMVLTELKLSKTDRNRLEKIIRACERELDDEAQSIIADQRYTYIQSITRQTLRPSGTELSLSDNIDKIVTDRVLALPIFALVLFGVYAIAMGSFPFSLGTIGSDWVNDVLFGRWIPQTLETLFQNLRVSGWLSGLILDGILPGVGTVLGFAPQILVLSLLLAVLEDVGYLSRVAFILDRILRRFGLSGKSIIPMLVATGCGVPGILASRTIEQENDRKITVMTTGFIPCSAKMSIVGLFAGAVFGNSPFVAVSAFFLGAGAVLLSGVILKKSRAFAGKPAPFVMELPSYHLPSVRNVLRATADRGGDFVRRATTIVLLSSIALWFLKGYGFSGGSFGPVADSNKTLLADFGRLFAWLFVPIGWQGDMGWKAVVATLTGLAAKEQVVMTLGSLYHFAGDLSGSGSEIWRLVAGDFGPARACSFLIFNLLCAPCFAAVGAIRREMGNRKWTWITVGYMCVFAYGISLIAFQLGGLLTGEAHPGIFTLTALGTVAGLVYLAARKGKGE